MKLNKKKVFTLALAVCLIAVLSMGSLAWFTDNDSLTNDFMIAGSENPDPNAVFSVDVWEDDEEEDVDGEEKIQDGIVFDAILPGDDLYKEVHIENTGSYEQYIRATVTVSDAHIWQEIFGVIYVPLNEIATDLNANFETYRIVYDAEADTLTYVLYYNTILPVAGDVVLFTNVAIPEALDQFQAVEMAGGFQINVVADAVQTQNVGNNAVEAFATVGMGVEAGNFTINVTIDNIDDILAILAENENAEASVNLGDMVVEAPVNNKGTLEIVGGSIVAENNLLINDGNLYVKDTKMEMTSGTAYLTRIREADSLTVFENVDVVTTGGGINVWAGEAVFVSGSIVTNSTSTSARHMFYIAQGAKMTIEDGEFTFNPTNLTRKGSYLCAEGAGSVIVVNGGIFHKASTRTAPVQEIDGGEVIIKGGTFAWDPTEWVADGYEAIYDAASRTWTVSAVQ